ncbi:LPS biosynthesis [Halobacterium salinarum NRC-1]|uniref:LPS biosynthesis n=3 Tax=Halobacterium salinarum TaxID=2242 RepID=Q9HSW1_HALSA|nr:glycosyltransferase family 4 protein [Halobacterium salinarum]AAG18689.1 LPS biosynthesis [Halobacterium salinarum NRC-1]MBB6091050.1 glycosyltransferase involved in cell wall biosynthesis [Halobacterium salinarum]UEB92102.1 glycosyltransferase family 4 protein [Halobacterium salinarum NRC-34001]CAP12932.1 probable glycosyltransferase, type 1 [Halobacterium salinarum R1]DAC77375.1 TPA_inf: probable glycosyltransferase, type 1 [Halobacterium salinarum NRC-1]
MHIAFIHPSFPSAEGTGATHSATQIVSGLSELDHDIDVYCASEPQQNRLSSDINLYHLDGESQHPHTNTKLNREVKARTNEFRKYDIVHSYLPSLIPSVANLGKNLDLSTVVTLNAYGGVCAKNDLLYLNEEHCEAKSNAKCLNCIARTGHQNNEQGYLYQTVSQLFSLRSINAGEDRLEYIDGFRAPSGHVRDNYTKFGFEEEKIHVIPHPLNDDFLVDHTSDFSEPINILYVGSLERHKGVDKLVPIIQGLRQREHDVELTVVGTGGLQSKMEEQSVNRNVEDYVDFAGFVSNEQLPSVYASHDVFIHPGIWEEPLARVYIEALATGTPIVTREYGSIETIIGDGGVTTDGSIDGFVQTIAELINANKLPALSEGGRSHVERYDRSQIVSQVEDLYGSVLT